MILRTLVLAVAVSLAASVQLYAQAKSPVEGVWKVAEVQVIGGANPGTNATPQPGFYIFTRGHYSIVTINADKPRTVIAQGSGTRPGARTDAVERRGQDRFVRSLGSGHCEFRDVHDPRERRDHQAARCEERRRDAGHTPGSGIQDRRQHAVADHEAGGRPDRGRDADEAHASRVARSRRSCGLPRSREDTKTVWVSCVRVFVADPPVATRSAGRLLAVGMRQQLPETRPQRLRQSLQPGRVDQTHVNQVAKMHAVAIAERRQLHAHERVQEEEPEGFR